MKNIKINGVLGDNYSFIEIGDGNIVIFTYEEFKRHYSTFKAIWGIEEYNNYSKVEEENENYQIEKKGNKIFRTLLDNKKDIVKFINKMFNQKFNEQQIEKYNSTFVNSMLKNQEGDVVYKIKDKNIFILIQINTKVDYLMSYRILQYEIAIIKSALDTKKLKNKSFKLPLVIPIVLYIGKRRWKDNKYSEEGQEELEVFKDSLSYYNIIDVNDFTRKELFEDNELISFIKNIAKNNIMV
ncbi:MAG: Rpn family recombination-promoting nuclease/putative transposase [Clostridia bacterium]|nr:Rpn family recombination-promoting nuclease/putative transposase [Clostridia bacterium]